MKTIIAPNGMKIIYNNADERKVQNIVKKAQEQFNIKDAKREERQKEYFLRVRARHEVWEAKKAKRNAEEPKAKETVEANLNSGTDEQVPEAV